MSTQTNEARANSYRNYVVMFTEAPQMFEVWATSKEAAIADLREAYADLGEVLMWGAR